MEIKLAWSLLAAMAALEVGLGWILTRRDDELRRHEAEFQRKMKSHFEDMMNEVGRACDELMAEVTRRDSVPVKPKRRVQ